MFDLFRRRQERDLDSEIAAHLAMQEDEFRAQGMSPAEARAAALRAFGGVAQTKEDYRDRRRGASLDILAQDVRYAFRGLRHSPGFTLAAVLSLALAIGANTAVFSLFHALMLRLLPVERPHELVSLFRTGGWGKGFVSYPLFQDVAKRSDLFTGVIARTAVEKVRFSPRPGDRQEFTQREFVSGNYFQVLGVRPAIGRLFTPDDDRTPGAHPLAVISYDLWRSHYAADPAILGAKILVDERPFTVIGVAAPAFHGVEVERRADIWAPIKMSGMSFTNPGSWWLWIVARRRPEVPEKQIQAALDVLMRQHLLAAYPPTYDPGFRKRVLEQRLDLRPAGIGLSMLRENFARPLTVLMGGVLLVLLAGCTNIANLLLARGAARRKEIALRLSLGATRARLVRQAITESILLVLAGGAIGAALAARGQRILAGFLPAASGNPFDPTPDPAVLLFTLAIAGLSVLLFGIGPALRSTAVDPADAIRGGTATRPAHTLSRRILVVAQVAFSVVLVALATLFGHNLFALRTVDLGFRNRNVLAFSLDLPRSFHSDARNPIRGLAANLRDLPGVTAVTYAFPGPYQMGTSSSTILVPGSERAAQEPVDVEKAAIAPGYFEIIGTPLVLGRPFEWNDLDSARKVAIVNEAFVRAFFPGDPHPDSRHLSFDTSRPGGEPVFIVGVVKDIRHAGIQQPAKPTVYVPILESDPALPLILVRTNLPTAALLPYLYRELARLGPSVALANIRTLGDQIEGSIFEQRILAALGGFFGLLALVLAAVGLYGVVSYSTARRTAEIGIRLALGSPRSRVLWIILRDSLILVFAGLALGLPAALAAARAVASVLFDIRPTDPLTWISTAALLTAVGLAAAFLPARRAAALDPTRTLRYE